MRLGKKSDGGYGTQRLRRTKWRDGRFVKHRTHRGSTKRRRGRRTFTGGRKTNGGTKTWRGGWTSGNTKGGWATFFFSRGNTRRSKNTPCSRWRSSGRTISRGRSGTGASFSRGTSRTICRGGTRGTTGRRRIGTLWRSGSRTLRPATIYRNSSSSTTRGKCGCSGRIGGRGGGK